MIITTSKRGGLRGYMVGSSLIPNYSFMPPVAPPACPCHKTRRGLGEDLYTGVNTDGSVDMSWTTPGGSSPSGGAWVSSDNPFALPGLNAGLTVGSGQSPTSYPSSPLPSAANLYKTPGAPGGAIFNGTTGVFQSPTALSSVIGGLTTTQIMLGGGALLLVLMMSRKRR